MLTADMHRMRDADAMDAVVERIRGVETVASSR